MKNTQNLNSMQALQSLSSLPEKMLRLHGTENISEFVLHDLCHKDCFNISKAAFFIDNPDFNCFKGIAGFDAQEHAQTCSLWDEPDVFTDVMKKSSFNQKVRAMNNHDRKHNLEDIADQLDVREAGYHTFALKHGNHGILVYDKHDSIIPDAEVFARGACFLGFCPVY